MDSDNKSNNLDYMEDVRWESLLCELIHKLGYDIETARNTGDGGFFITCRNTQSQSKREKYLIQCWRWYCTFAMGSVDDLYKAMAREGADRGMLIAVGHFTPGALDYAYSKQIELIDRQELRNLLSQHCSVNVI